MDGTDIVFQISKSDGSPWTNDEVESLFMVANGKVIAASASSSVDFYYQGSQVAYIDRVFVGETHATVHCSANGFDGAAYSITYLGFDEPPVSLIITPTPPVDLHNADVILRKSDGSNFTVNEVANLQIVMGGNVLTLIDSPVHYEWGFGGTPYLSCEKLDEYEDELYLNNATNEQFLNSISFGS